MDNLGEEDEEKMWDILNILEGWKVHISLLSCVTPGTHNPAQKSQDIVMKNQKHLAEIKATLLPIVSALNRPSVLPDEVHPEVGTHFDSLAGATTCANKL